MQFKADGCCSAITHLTTVLSGGVKTYLDLVLCWLVAWKTTNVLRSCAILASGLEDNKLTPCDTMEGLSPIKGVASVASVCSAIGLLQEGKKSYFKVTCLLHLTLLPWLDG